MSLNTQLNLFENTEDPLWLEYRNLENKQDKLRRGIFQRHNAILKIVVSLQEEIVSLREELNEYKQSK